MDTSQHLQRNTSFLLVTWFYYSSELLLLTPLKSSAGSFLLTSVLPSSNLKLSNCWRFLNCLVTYVALTLKCRLLILIYLIESSVKFKACKSISHAFCVCVCTLDLINKHDTFNKQSGIGLDRHRSFASLTCNKFLTLYLKKFVFH